LADIVCPNEPESLNTDLTTAISEAFNLSSSTVSLLKVNRDNAASLVDSASELKKYSLWSKVDKTDKDGNIAKEYLTYPRLPSAYYLSRQIYQSS